jgi:hypothetical protein
MKWPFDYTEATSVDDDNLFFGAGLVGGIGKRQRKVKAGTVRAWISSWVQTITNLWTFSSGIVTPSISLSSGRQTFEEKPFAAITTPGWYQIAYVPSGARYNSFGANFRMFARGGNRRGSIDFSILGHDEGGVNGVVDLKIDKINLNAFLGVRLAYATTAGKGQFLEVYINPDSPTYDITGYIQMTKNCASSSTDVGWVLMMPTPSTGKLPDGITTASYFNAGSILREDVGYDYHFDGNISLIKTTDTTAFITINWPECPFFRASGLAINFPTRGLSVVSADGVTVNRAVNESNLSISSLYIKDKKIKATLTDTVSSPALFSVFSIYQPIFLRWYGANGSIELI